MIPAKTHKKVTMELTLKDVERTDAIRGRLQSRSNAAAVGAALSVADLVTKAMVEGHEVLIRNQSGEMQKLVVAGL